LKHGNLVVWVRIPYLKLDEPSEKFIEWKMTTPDGKAGDDASERTGTGTSHHCGT